MVKLTWIRRGYRLVGYGGFLELKKYQTSFQQQVSF